MAVVSFVAVAALVACGGGGSKPTASPSTSSSSAPSSSSSSSSGSGTTTKVDPCKLTAADVQAVIGVAVADGAPNGTQICRYLTSTSDVPVEVVVRPATQPLSELKAQEPSEYLIVDVPEFGDGAFYAEGGVNGYLYAVKGGNEFNVNVSSPLDPDSGEATEDTATRKAHAIAVMTELLS